MSIERLTGEDELMLWPDEVWPQHIGALVILDGDRLFDARGRFRIEAMRVAIAARLHLLPRFRQVLQVPPRSLGPPYWTDAPAFDLAQHVHVRSVPAPGDEPELLLVAEELRRRRLDRTLPLWEMWFLTGLPGGRVGWFVKVHHCIADGIAGIATFATLLDASEGAPAGAPRPWAPAPGPTEAELLADHQSRRHDRRRRRLTSLAHPVSTLKQVAAAWPAVRELLAARPGPATSLDRMVGGDRRFALVRSRVELVRNVAHANGANVNDVLLAAAAGGLRRLLEQRGEPVQPGTALRVYVPVTLRPVDQRENATGNQISQIAVPLPVGIPDPVQLLRSITVETARRKASGMPNLGKVPHRGLAGRVFLGLVARQRVNVTTADLVGPPVPLYLSGAQILEVFPVLPLVANESLGIGALSYAGGFGIAVVADGAGYPDLDVFADGVREVLTALASSIEVGAANPRRKTAGTTTREGTDEGRDG